MAPPIPFPFSMDEERHLIAQLSQGDHIVQKTLQWLDGELKQQMDSASHHGNEMRVGEIEEVAKSIRNSSTETRKIIDETFATGETLKEKLNNMQDAGNEQRDQVISLREKVDANQKRVSERIGS